MEHQLWTRIVAVLAGLGRQRKSTRQDFSDEQIVRTYYWAVLHDRPVSWACQRGNWPIYLRRGKLPSSSTMSRRVRTPGVRALLLALERSVLAPKEPFALGWAIDGKPLVISGCSKDRQAGYGRAAGGKAKGYKIHAIIGPDDSVAAWRVAPMNKDERVMARRLLREASIQGYLLADSNYDSNDLHELCDERGDVQMIVPRRNGPNRGHGHRKQSAGRMRSQELLENPGAEFGKTLHQQRDYIERFYGNLTNWGGALNHLPAWVRTHRRVHRWVQAKFVLTALRRAIPKTVCDAG
jgi:Transposase DDE domain